MKVSRENIDEYYKKVNSKIDHFFGKGVTSEGLKRYLKKGSYGIQKFTKREKLEDIEGIEKVIEDCIEDRFAMDESVKTFEAFQNNDDDFSFDIFQSTEQHIEKMVADLYKVSLGHIKSEYNHIELTGVKMSKDIYVFHTSKMRDIITEVSDKLYETMIKDTVEYNSLNIEISLNNKIDKETFVNNVFNELYKKKEDILEEILIWETDGKYLFKQEKNGLFIFEKQ